MSTIERITIFVSVVGVVAVCIWFGIATHSRPIASLPTPTSPAPSAVSPDAQAGRVSSVVQVQVGEVGAVDAGVGETDIATTWKALIGLAQAGEARNQKAYDSFFTKGLAFRVPDGTRAKLITGGEQVNEVQFVDGDLSGKTGWIPAEWIRPTNSIPRKDRVD